MHCLQPIKKRRTTTTQLTHSPNRCLLIQTSSTTNSRILMQPPPNKIMGRHNMTMVKNISKITTKTNNIMAVRKVTNITTSNRTTSNNTMIRNSSRISWTSVVMYRSVVQLIEALVKVQEVWEDTFRKIDFKSLRWRSHPFLKKAKLLILQSRTQV